MMRLIRDQYNGTLIVAGGFDVEEAKEWVGNGKADLIAFGRKFLANPDLPQRFRLGAHLNADDATTYYGGGAKGYTDYPSLDQERGEGPMLCVESAATSSFGRETNDDTRLGLRSNRAAGFYGFAGTIKRFAFASALAISARYAASSGQNRSGKSSSQGPMMPSLNAASPHFAPQ